MPRPKFQFVSAGPSSNDRDDNILQKGCWEDFLKRVNMQAAAVAGECTWRRRRAIEEAQHLNLPQEHYKMAKLPLAFPWSLMRYISIKNIHLSN